MALTKASQTVKTINESFLKTTNDGPKLSKHFRKSENSTKRYGQGHLGIRKFKRF